MKIIVFGATGGTGKLIVSQALAKGHSVTAFVRNPEGLTAGSASSRQFRGTCSISRQWWTPFAATARCCLRSAHAAGKRRTYSPMPSPVILEAMRQEYVTRLIVLGASGVQRDHGKYQNALTNMAIWVAKKTLLKHPFIDQAAQERLLAASDVDYTIVRATQADGWPVHRSR